MGLGGGCPTTSRAPAYQKGIGRSGRTRWAMPAVLALTGLAQADTLTLFDRLMSLRRLTEEEDEEDTSADYSVPAGMFIMVLWCCAYCLWREKANRMLGCPEDSYCGLSTNGDSDEICGNCCTTGAALAEDAKATVGNRVRV